MFKPSVSAVCALASLLAPAAWTQTHLPEHTPLPFARPTLATPSGGEPAHETIPTDPALPAALDRLDLSDQAGLELTRAALDALASGHVEGARAMRDRLPPGSLDHKVVAWAIARSDTTGASGEIAATIGSLVGWPGLAVLGDNLERALAREAWAPQAVVRHFDGIVPATTEGTVVLARAHLALGDRAAAIDLLIPFWSQRKLSAGDERAIIDEFGTIIPSPVHRKRMEVMLYQDRIRSAERVAPLAGGQALTRAWAAVTRGREDAAALLEAVPVDQRTGGWIYAKARSLRRSGDSAGAAALVLEAARHEAPVLDADAWWVERRALARELLDQGDAASAYRVAASHAAQSAAMIADAEFHAGWLALRALGDPHGAARHFSRIADIASGPISLSRAFYWLGRSAEAGGPGHASSYYEQAASHATGFYGQLAAARLGRSTIDIADPEPTAAERTHFAAREGVRAIERLERAGHWAHADRLYRAYAAELTSSGELVLLVQKATERGDHHLALRLAKIAAGRGFATGSLAYPTGAIPQSAGLSDAATALAHAVARQESEFNIAAVSQAGARGLLQLLPGTARDMARRAGLGFSPSLLTRDAAYNAKLGTAYLDQQIEGFQGSYILALVAYNAGPGRARQWIARYGDPHGQPLERVIDWIERIPFTETRSYVQRVMENYQIYQMRLTGRFDIVADLVTGR